MRVVTRIWCTESYTSARTARSHVEQFFNLLGHGTVNGVVRRLGCLHNRCRVEHPGQFGAVPGRLGAGIQQPVRQPLQQVAVAACREFQLPFAPLLFRAVGVGLCRHLVIAEFGEGSAVRRAQHVDGSAGRDPRNRCERAITDDGQHDVAQRLRYFVFGRVAQRFTHFCAGIRSRRQFEVPPGVGATGAPAQCHVSGRQIAAGRVEVDGVELMRGGPLHPGDRRQTVE